MKSSSLCPKGFISSFLLYFLNFRAATAHDIKVAYRRLALELHPDVNNSCPTKSEEFKLAAQAYETLSDHSQRSRYDQQFFGASHYHRHSKYTPSTSTHFSQGRGRIYAPQPPPGFKRFDHDKWKHYHYGDGIMEEQIQMMKKRAEAASSSYEESTSPLGKGFYNTTYREKTQHLYTAKEEIRLRMQHRVKNRPPRKQATPAPQSNNVAEYNAYCSIM
mmetsp:Transcript_28237/g.40436  ORF Transcript_28237/g.40436 Transcript_28237/m.40436 type:complete len:218 (-) Transcript_28237:67-720(-)